MSLAGGTIPFLKQQIQPFQIQIQYVLEACFEIFRARSARPEMAYGLSMLRGPAT